MFRSSMRPSGMWSREYKTLLYIVCCLLAVFLALSFTVLRVEKEVLVEVDNPELIARVLSLQQEVERLKKEPIPEPPTRAELEAALSKIFYRGIPLSEYISEINKLYPGTASTVTRDGVSFLVVRVGDVLVMGDSLRLTP